MTMAIARALRRSAWFFVSLLGMNCQACDLTFQVVGDPDQYTYETLPAFIREEIRPRVKAGSDSERYGLQIQYACAPPNSSSSLSAIFKIQPNTIYLKDVNELPLCVEKIENGRTVCDHTKYNYVDYKGGAPLEIDKASVIQALRALSETTSTSDLETVDAAKRSAIHNAVRLFAMLLAESARFDYVLDDLTCAIGNGASLHFMDYWGLVHNWATIARAVGQSGEAGEALKAPATFKGAGSLFVPITRPMVPFFNGFLPSVQGKPGWETTADGKNKLVDLREPSCSLVPMDALLPVDDQAQAERDEIFSLLAMAMVLQDWQTSAQGRGHNIGSILVNKEHVPLYYARNSIRALDNATQHGEVRLVQNYLDCKGVAKTASSLTVYTTLEPCAMCSGMMTMTEVSRVVYLQRDPSFGGAREALRGINYPRVYQQSTTNGLPQKSAIEAGYDQYRNSGKGGLTSFLLTDDARKFFESSREALLNYSVKAPENVAVLTRAKAYLQTIKSESFGVAMAERCPAP